MKLFATFVKTFRENIRDWKILVIAVTFGPFFVYLMYMYLGDSGMSGYTVALLNRDSGGKYAEGMIAEWRNLKTDGDDSVLKIVSVDTGETGLRMIREHDADLFVTVPAEFSRSLDEYIASEGRGDIPSLVSSGDQSSAAYMMAASFVDYTAFAYIAAVTGNDIPLSIEYEAAGGHRALSGFDLYVPALFVLAVIMILFTSGASIIREVEKETIIRLSLSKLSPSGFLAAVGLNQIIIGVTVLLLTYLAALTIGYKSGGSLPLVLLIGVVTSFSVVAVSIITACFIKNMFGLLTVGCFPLFIMIFFSDCFVALPRIHLFGLFGNSVFFNDLLPTATAARALNQVMNFGAGFSDIAFETGLMLCVSIIYYALGTVLFGRKYRP